MCQSRHKQLKLTMDNHTMNSVLKTSASAAVLALFAAAPAIATDLKNTSDPTSAHYYDAPFQGVGGGVSIGGQFTNIDVTAGGFSFDGIGADGLVGGAHLEYLFAVGGNFRVGLYAEGGISNVNTDLMGMDAINQDWFGGAGAKAGFVISQTLIYGKLGYEWSKWSIFDEAAEADVESVLIGGGIETMIAQNVSLGVEGNYIVPVSIDVEGADLTEFLEETESFRGVVRLTYRH